MNLNQLPQKWRDRIIEHIRIGGDSENETLGATDFGNTCVRLTFPDGSEAFFNYAFYLTDPLTNELAVFTEHCGYHLFPLWETKIETLRSEWSEVGSSEVEEP